MRVEFLKELLENPMYQTLTVKQFTATIKKSGIWDFDPNEEQTVKNEDKDFLKKECRDELK